MERNQKDVVTNELEPNYKGWKAMPFVIGNETFEKLGTTGTSNNLLVYLTTVFNMKSITATNLVNIFNGTTNLATLLGAYLCDTYFGRYKTLGFASVSSFLGMVLLTLTAAVSILHPPKCTEESQTGSCPGPTRWQVAFLLSSLGLLVIGAGGIRPCNLAFGADQFNPKTDSGKRGIGSFFNWYYFTYTFAMMVSLTIIVYIQSDVSWAWGLAIPAFMMFLSCTMFFVGSNIYVKVRPDGSPLTSVFQVLVAAVKKRRLKLPEEPQLTLFNYVPASSINSRLPHSLQFMCLDKAAIIAPGDKINPDGSQAHPWNLCSMQNVEEVKCIVRIIPIWVSAVVYFIALVQQQNYVVFQALQSDRRLGNTATSFKIPAATYNIFSMIALTIWIPLYDRIVVPWITRKQNGRGITVLTKMGIGMFIATGTMVVSAVVENKRRDLAREHPIGFEQRRGAISSLSALWLVPQLTLAGLSEAFTVIGTIELYYSQFPENMRSFAGSFNFVGFAGSSYLSSLLITIVHKMTQNTSGGGWLPEDLNKGRLDYFYYLVGAIEAINLVCFVLFAKWYKYKGTGGEMLEQEILMENLHSGKPSV